MDKLADVILVAGTIVIFWAFGFVAQADKAGITPQPGAMHFSENGSEWNGDRLSSGWSGETLLWWEEAATKLSELSDAVDSGWTAVGDHDQEAVKDAMSLVEQAALFFDEADPPAALSPFAVQAEYAGTLCKFTLAYASEIVNEDGGIGLSTVGQLATLRNDCVGAVHDARMEAARYAAAAGDTPPKN